MCIYIINTQIMSEKKITPEHLTEDKTTLPPLFTPVPPQMTRQISEKSPDKISTPIVIPEKKFGYIDSHKLYYSVDEGAGTYIDIPIFYEYLREDLKKNLSRICLRRIKKIEFTYNETIPINEIIISFKIIDEHSSHDDMDIHISFHPPGITSTTHIRSVHGIINYSFYSNPQEKSLVISEISRSGYINFESSANCIINAINYILKNHYDKLFIPYYELSDEFNKDLNKKIAQYNNYISNIKNIDSYITYLTKHHTHRTPINRKQIDKMMIEKQCLYKDIINKLGKTPAEFIYELNNYYIELEDKYYKKYIKYKNKYQNLKIASLS